MDSGKKYKARFSTNVKVKKHLSEEQFNNFKESFASVSDSMEHLKIYLPSLQSSHSEDLLSVAFDSAVINLVNANDDGILAKSAINLAKSSPYKFINLEHNRSYIVGTLSNYGFSTLDGENISEEDALNSDEPFYMCLGGFLWKSVDRHLASIIEEASQPNSDFYKEFAVSWEVGFENYDIALGSKKLKDAIVVSSEEDKAKYDKSLRCNGGNGFLSDGTPVYRIISDESPILYGIGITSNPAAPVSGILTASAIANKILEKNEKNISQENNLNVTKISMINNISDITDESLKLTTASAIRDFIKDEIRNKDAELTQKVQEAQAERDRAATELESYKTKASELEASSETLKDKISVLEQQIAQIQEAQAQAEKAEKFDLRIQSLKEGYNLDDRVVEIIAAEIADLDDTAFELWKNKFDIIGIGFKKTSSQEEQKQNAFASAQAEDPKIPNAQSAENDDIRKKFASAFKISVNKNQVKL